MSKIVAIMGSPESNGNTAAIVDTLITSSMSYSTHIFKLYSLGKLNYVHGCNHCLRCRGQKSCAIEDEITPVLKDLCTADIIIFSTPIYFNMPSAQFKMVIDRMFAYYCKDSSQSVLAGKKAIVAVTYSNDKDNAKYIANSISSALGEFNITVTDKMIFSDEDETHSFVRDKVAIQKVSEIGKRYMHLKEFVVNPEIVDLNE